MSLPQCRQKARNALETRMGTAVCIEFVAFNKSGSAVKNANIALAKALLAAVNTAFLVAALAKTFLDMRRGVDVGEWFMCHVFKVFVAQQAGSQKMRFLRVKCNKNNLLKFSKIRTNNQSKYKTKRFHKMSHRHSLALPSEPPVIIYGAVG